MFENAGNATATEMNRMTKCRLCKEDAKYESHLFGDPYCLAHLKIVQTANECDECQQYKPGKMPYTWGRRTLCEDCLVKLARQAFLNARR